MTLLISNMKNIPYILVVIKKIKNIEIVKEKTMYPYN